MNTKIKFEQELGRSMVEMLGVLAVIGLLSIGGIAGYKNAMNKHRANELLNEASKRAVIVAAQRSLGRGGSIAEFKQPAHYTFALTDAQNPNQFNLTITSVDEVVYEKMAELKGDKTPLRFIERSGDGVVTLTYNNDMSTTAYASDYRTLEDCRGDGQQGRTWCNAGVCVSGGASNCPANCPNGTTWTGEGDANTALADGKCQCTDWTTKQCGDNYYCEITDYQTTGTCGANKAYYTSIEPGKCKPIKNVDTPDATKLATLTAVGFKNTFVTSGSQTMNWWTAKSWCLGQDKDLITVDSMNCYNTGTSNQITAGSATATYCCASGATCASWSGAWSSSTLSTEANYSPKIVALGKVYGTSKYFWTDSNYYSNSDSCRAFGVYLYEGSVSNFNRYYYDGDDDDVYALCE